MSNPVSPVTDTSSSRSTPSPVIDTSSTRSITLAQLELMDDQDIADESEALQLRALLRSERDITRKENAKARGAPPPLHPLVLQFPDHQIDLVDIDNCDLAGIKVRATITNVGRCITDSEHQLGRIRSKAGTYIEAVKTFISIVKDLHKKKLRKESNSMQFD